MHRETETQPFGMFLESIVLISVKSTLHMKYLYLVVQYVFDLSRLSSITTEFQTCKTVWLWQLIFSRASAM